jgi:hypothetical protein
VCDTNYSSHLWFWASMPNLVEITWDLWTQEGAQTDKHTWQNEVPLQNPRWKILDFSNRDNFWSVWPIGLKFGGRFHTTKGYDFRFSDFTTIQYGGRRRRSSWIFRYVWFEVGFLKVSTLASNNYSMATSDADWDWTIHIVPGSHTGLCSIERNSR